MVKVLKKQKKSAEMASKSGIFPENLLKFQAFCYSSFDLSSIYTVKYHLTMRIRSYQLSFLISMISGLRYRFPVFSDLPVI